MIEITAGSTDEYIQFYNGGVTGLSSFTVYRVRDGGTPAAMTTPTVTELDATNMPGWYSLLVDEDTTISVSKDREAMGFTISAAGMADVNVSAMLVRNKISEGSTLTVGGVTGAADANVALISGDSTAADNLEADYDGTGYNKSASTIGTCTTNSDMRGTDSALLAASAPTNWSAMDITVGGSIKIQTLVDTDIGTAAFTPAKFGSGFITASSIATDAIDADAIAADAVTEIQSGLATSSALATVDANVDAILVDTGTTLDGKLNDIQGATFDTSTDSLEAIRNRGDAAWTGGGGGGGSSNAILKAEYNIPKLTAVLVE